MLLKSRLNIYYKLLKKWVIKIIYYQNNEFYIYIDFMNIKECTELLKNSLFFNINSLVDMACIDWLVRIPNRFSIYYNFYSYVYNYRLFIIIDIPLYLNYFYGVGIESICSVFPAAIWLEREIWDMFGVYFYNHFDLRRILTDYGFVGFPFRKDFPLVGFKELRYDDTYKIIVYENIKLMQDYRVFDFINPWEKD
jgi:NADH:ubiquinone oxidoreductase subunit C